MTAHANLYEVPGRRGVLRNRVLAAVITVALGWLGYLIYARFDERDQWAAEKWQPLLRADVWTTFILPGLRGTLEAAGLGIVLAGAFGLLFATARMSEHTWIRVPAAAVVEFFRAVPFCCSSSARSSAPSHSPDRPSPRSPPWSSDSRSTTDR